MSLRCEQERYEGGTETDVLVAVRYLTEVKDVDGGAGFTLTATR